MGKLSLLAALSVAFLAGQVALAKEKTEGGRKEEKKVCTVDRETKSRIPKKICRTQAEMELRSAQDDLDDAVSRLRTQGRVN